MDLDRLPADIRAILADLVEATANSGSVTRDGRNKQAVIRESIILLRPAAAAWDRMGRPLEPVEQPPKGKAIGTTKKPASKPTAPAAGAEE